MKINSHAIQPGEMIPRAHTADGQNVSPPLAWSEVPPEARELALILEDVKSTGERRFVHWVVYSIPPRRQELGPGIQHRREPTGAVTQGRNSLGNVGYNGPDPAAGISHRYRFRLLALDQPTELPPGAAIDELEREIDGHVIAEADLEATYER